MKDVIFRNDTKLRCRKDIRETIAEVTKGHKVMFVYGSGSVKRNGCYNDIIRTLTDADIHFVEYGASSREFSKIQEGIRFAKSNGVTLIVGAGGASVMDSAKLMAFGFYHESDLWDYLKGKPSYGLQRLPLVLIPTYPSSGSENGRFEDGRFRDGIRHTGRLCYSLSQIFPDFRQRDDRIYGTCYTGSTIGVYFGRQKPDVLRCRNFLYQKRTRSDEDFIEESE